MRQGVMVLWLIAVAIFGIILTYMRKIDKEKLYIFTTGKTEALSSFTDRTMEAIWHRKDVI